MFLTHKRLHHAPRISIMNYANAGTPGGGYIYGSLAQEEALCRQFPLYYGSLRSSPFPRRKETRNYPNYRSGDVLVTPNQVAMRDSTPAMAPPDEKEQWTATLVAVAAPNLNNG